VPHGDNPAARLRWFMEQLSGYSGSQEDTKPAAPAIASIFYIPYPDDAATLWARLADVADLARETRALANALPPRVVRSRMRYFDTVEQTVSNFGAVMNMTVWALLEPMRPHGQHALELAEELLDEHAPEPVLDDDVVRGLIEETRQLADAIRDLDDMPPDVRRWLLDRLAEILRVLDNIKLYGYPRVEQEVERLVGGLVRSQERAQGVTRSRAWDRFKAWFIATDTALNLAANALLLAQALGPATHPTPTPSPSPVIQIIEWCGDVTPQLPPGDSAHRDYDYDVDGDEDEGHGEEEGGR
jgi:hypothetical protein